VSPSPNMTVEEIAALLGCSRQTVYDQAGRGVIPCIRLGRKIVFPRAAVLEWHRTAGRHSALPVTSGA